MIGRSFVIIFVSLCSCAPMSIATEQELLSVESCELFNKPFKFLRQKVKLSAGFRTDGIDRAILYNKNCVGSNGIGLSLGSIDMDKYNSIFQLASFASKGGESKVRATFYGTIIRVAPNDLQYGGDRGARFSINDIMEIEAIEK